MIHFVNFVNYVCFQIRGGDKMIHFVNFVHFVLFQNRGWGQNYSFCLFCHFVPNPKPKIEVGHTALTGCFILNKTFYFEKRQNGQN